MSVLERFTCWPKPCARLRVKLAVERASVAVADMLSVKLAIVRYTMLCAVLCSFLCGEEELVHQYSIIRF